MEYTHYRNEFSDTCIVRPNENIWARGKEEILIKEGQIDTEFFINDLNVKVLRGIIGTVYEISLHIYEEIVYIYRLANIQKFNIVPVTTRKFDAGTQISVRIANNYPGARDKLKIGARVISLHNKEE